MAVSLSWYSSSYKGKMEADSLYLCVDAGGVLNKKAQGPLPMCACE